MSPGIRGSWTRPFPQSRVAGSKSWTDQRLRDQSWQGWGRLPGLEVGGGREGRGNKRVAPRGLARELEMQQDVAQGELEEAWLELSEGPLRPELGLS